MPSRLVEFEIARPAVYGVNTSASGDVMPKEYAVKAQNLVISEEGYAESRRGSRVLHSDTLRFISSLGTDQRVRQIFQTTDQNGDDLTIFSTENAVYKIDGAVVTDITGTMTTPTAGNWKFVNLNDEIIGFQKGHIACIMTNPASGTFANATLTGSEAPVNTTSSVVQDVLGAFGRLWVLEGDQLRYSSLLAPTDFDPTGGDAGAFDLNASYLSGDDIPMALAEFNGNLVVLARNNITIWANPWNPNGTGAGYGGGYGGVPTDPAMSIIENITSIGCVARDSVQHTQNDLVFLTEQGVTTLSRVVQEKSMPISRLSDNMRSDVIEMLRCSATNACIWSVYHESKGLYIFGSASFERCFTLDMSGQLPDGTHRMTTWEKQITTMAIQPQANLTADDDGWESMFISDQDNYLSYVTGFKDYNNYAGDAGSSYDILYESAWTAILDEFQNNIKMPKKIGVVLKGTGSQAYHLNIAFDYGDYVDSREKTGVSVLANVSRYGIATYSGTGIYGSASEIKLSTVSGFGKGRIMKIRVQSTVDGFLVGLQRISINAKLGRQQ
jgi:hypothetical protein